MASASERDVSLESQIGTLRARQDELVVEVMTKSGELSEARSEIRRLRAAIEDHREQTGHNLCWLNDVELWKALGDGDAAYPRETVVSADEFFVGCRAYYASRFVPAPGDARLTS